MKFFDIYLKDDEILLWEEKFDFIRPIYSLYWLVKYKLWKCLAAITLITLLAFLIITKLLCLGNMPVFATFYILLCSISNHVYLTKLMKSGYQWKCIIAADNKLKAVLQYYKQSEKNE